MYFRTSLAVQWLGLGTFTAMAPGSIPVWGSSLKPRSAAGKKKKRMYFNLYLMDIPDAKEYVYQ